MPINFVTGLPRTGKTLWTLCYVKELADKEKRAVYTCNIPEMKVPGWLEIDHPDKWMEVPDGSIIIVDELQDFWCQAAVGATVPKPILELSKHGKRGIDFYFITQEPDLVHRTPRGLCEHHYFIVRAFGSNNVMVHKFQRMQLHPEKVKKTGERFPWRYNKNAFDWYKSGDVHNIKTKIPLKVWAIPLVLLLAGFAVWLGLQMFGGVINKAQASAQTGQASPGAVGRSATGVITPIEQKARILTSAEYVQSFVPRVEGLAYTAPRYDAVTAPVTAPMPSACIDGKKPGSKVKTCHCWTQQATVLPVPEQICRQIAAGGFFDDTQQPQRTESQQRTPQAMTAPAPIEQLSQTVFIDSTSILPPPQTKSTVQRDGEVLAFMRKREYIK